MHYKTKHFQIFELIPRALYALKLSQGRLEQCWQFLDPRALITLDVLWERHGHRCYVNSYYWQGAREWSGLRTPECPIGADLSQHKHGRGFDPIFESSSIQEVHEDILTHPDIYPHITCIEKTIKGETPSWLHYDVRNYAGVLELNL